MPKAKPGTVPKQTSIAIPERYPSGKPKPQSPEPVWSPTLIKRLKDHGGRVLKDKRLGTVLGIMHLEGVLTESEAEAGMRYAEDVGAYERITSAPRRTSRSPNYEGGFNGASQLDIDALRRMDPEAADRAENRIRRRRKAVKKRYDAVQAYVPAFPIAVSALLEEVCCNDRPIHSSHHATLKAVLGNLAKFYQAPERQPGAKVRHLSEIQSGQQHKPISKKSDASLLAVGAIDAMEQWFAVRNAEIVNYRVRSNAPKATPGLTCFGRTKGGVTISHTIPLPRSGLMLEEINAQLVRIAEDEKGWKPSAAISKEQRETRDE